MSSAGSGRIWFGAGAPARLGNRNVNLPWDPEDTDSNNFNDHDRNHPEISLSVLVYGELNFDLVLE